MPFYSTLLPLVGVLAVTAVKDAYDDIVSCIYMYMYIYTRTCTWVTSFITSRPVCVYSCSQLRELWFNDLFMYIHVHVACA